MTHSVTRLLTGCSLAFLAVLTFASSGHADSLYSRNLSCPRFAAPRERQICQSLEWEMEWTWTGHAIIAPSFRVTFETAKKVFCALSLSAADTLALVDIVVRIERNPDNAMASLQLANGSRFLLFLLGATALRVFPERQKNWDDREWQVVKNLKEEVALKSSDPGMICNPANPQYLLRGGC
jgi:hypothetical protein